MPVDRADLMALSEVMQTYGHTRSWWYQQINAGSLVVYDVPGDRNTYLSRTAIEAFLQPRPRQRNEGAQATDETA